MHGNRRSENKIIDSYLFLAMRLSKIPEAMGIPNLAKGYHPYHFTDLNYVGPMQPRSQGFSIFVIGKAGKGPGTGRSCMYSDWSMTSTILCK